MGFFNGWLKLEMGKFWNIDGEGGEGNESQ